MRVVNIKRSTIDRIRQLGSKTVTLSSTETMPTAVGKMQKHSNDSQIHRSQIYNCVSGFGKQKVLKDIRQKSVIYTNLGSPDTVMITRDQRTIREH
ncbi:hypothetical protein ACJMK2_028759 [Sinanodonta woodiana]|uniref:Uncharacterized protein n=1 Tax=Sinanodonta woodiana TaxID=1069815 RepID=A0ABD3XA17_SINWO